MNKFSRGVAVGVLSAAAVFAAPAIAAPVVLDISGTAGSAGAYTGVVNLDVNNGSVTSATGTISIAGLVNTPLALITTSTSGNINDGSAYPVGFRANDGTDYFETDQNYPLDLGGLLFAVGTTTPAFGQNPLINLYNDGTSNLVAFTGKVNGTEYYNQSGSLNIANVTGAVPEPASWAMMILGMGAVGFAMRSAKRRSDEKFDAKIKKITYGAIA